MTAPDRTQPEPARVITVLSDLAPDGSTYVATVQLDPDTARTLNRDQGYAWASTVLAAAARAEHDARVLHQMTEILNLPLHTAAACLGDLRADRPPLDDAATAPMRLQPGVNQAGEPFVGVFVHGTQIGQWTCQDARSHANGVFEVTAAVDLDAAFYRYLLATGADQPTAHRAVTTLPPPRKP